MYKYLLIFITVLYSSISFAMGEATPWQMNLHEAVTPVMEEFEHFHNHLLFMCFAIGGFVFLLLAYVCIRFRKSANPNPATFTHNTTLEIIWTIIPVIILLALIAPSLRSLYLAEKNIKSEMTLKVIGSQWFWTYEYDLADQSHFSFDSYIVKEADLKPGELRLQDVDNPVVLPIDTDIRILITARDVLHSWGVQAFGVKKDAIPGRTNETWVRITKPGKYYGHCYELCGVNHGFMPIVVMAVSKEEFVEWTKNAKEKFAYTNINQKFALNKN